MWQGKRASRVHSAVNLTNILCRGTIYQKIHSHSLNLWGEYNYIKPQSFSIRGKCLPFPSTENNNLILKRI